MRAEPDVLWTITRELADLGFAADGQSPTGHQHRWVREGASIDILIPATWASAPPHAAGTEAGRPSRPRRHSRPWTGPRVSRCPSPVASGPSVARPCSAASWRSPLPTRSLSTPGATGT
ncbi:hypothetical protein NKG05_00810 [Oerskovia sp. M15]